jgi:phenylacetate-coenzyme A ligase PaaK-like adenylate-forming protein
MNSKDGSPSVTIQLEGGGRDDVVLTAAELRGYARALARCWHFLGVRRADKVIIFDYGTSPMAYLASAAFIPHLDKGASETLGCIALCCDGAPQLAPRAVRAARLIAPAALFVRPDCLLPFWETAEKEGADQLRDNLRFIAVGQNEGILKRIARETWMKRTGLPIYGLARSDRALFISPQCPKCHLFHIWPDLYRLQIVHADTHTPVNSGQDGQVAIRTSFAKDSGTWQISGLQGRLVPKGCELGRQHQRLSI